jgi:L-amino acid N-acyltransferase YncA
LKIRAATPADQDAIWAILKPAFRAGDTYTVDPDIPREDALGYWCAATHLSFVAEDAGEVLGTYYLRRNQGGGGRHVCNCGYVTAPWARGRGVASAMLTHSLEEARALGYRAMQYNFVVETNEGAIRLWRRAGFEEVGRLPGVFLHPERGYVDALVMMKSLVEPE